MMMERTERGLLVLGDLLRPERMVGADWRLFRVYAHMHACIHLNFSKVFFGFFQFF